MVSLAINVPKLALIQAMDRIVNPLVCAKRNIVMYQWDVCKVTKDLDNLRTFLLDLFYDIQNTLKEINKKTTIKISNCLSYTMIYLYRYETFLFVYVVK